jgi:trehalose 6-phosphate synthase
MKQTLLTSLTLVLLVTLVTLGFTVQQVSREEQRLLTDLQYRTSLLSETVRVQVESAPSATDSARMTPLLSGFVREKRLVGALLYSNKDTLVASSSGLPRNTSQINTLAANAMDSDGAAGRFMRINSRRTYVLAIPVHRDREVAGSLALLQNAGFIDDQLGQIWKNNFLYLGAQASLILLAVFLTLRFIVLKPVRDLVDTIRLTRLTSSDPKDRRLPDNFLFRPLIREIARIGESLHEARQVASEEAKLRLEKIESPWTQQRLFEYAKQILKNRTIFVVSNREPYIHTKKGKEITWYVPASGMVTAIEPMIQSCGGTWIASASGDADKLTVDEHNKVRVPPDDPKYTLKRVWLTKEEEEKYYYGYSNEGIWPLCHMAHTRPVFREEDWNQYQAVNGKFAKEILREIKGVHEPLIIVQDFHFSLLPRMIKNARPDAQIALFWHIPWPNAEAFGICPNRAQILDGMLGADLVGFHTQLHCNNFIETVGRELESLIDLEQFSITKNSHKTMVKPFPISIAFPKPAKEDEDKRAILDEYEIPRTKYVGVGVDRLDYTKGILERLQAIEQLLEKEPQYKENFTFIQIAPQSRSQIEAYHRLETDVEQEVKRINAKFRKDGWKPIVLLKKHHAHEEINKFYRLANVCVVTSLHDGMNLVAKEYIAARSDEKGVLVLSKFAGASRELKKALVINPYDIDELSQAIHTALQMNLVEQKYRMNRMRESVQSYNIYRWSAELLKTLVNLG